MPEPQGAYQQGYQEQGGVQGALTRQIGPLKAWQWGVAIGGAFLIWKFAGGGGGGGGSNPSTTAFVPTSSDDTGDAINNGNDNGGLPKVTITKDVKKVFKWFSGKTTKRTAIRNKAGKIIGYFAAGRTILVGKKVKFGNKWYYPILNMPGKYILAGSVKLTPVYGDQTTTTTTTTNGTTTAALASTDQQIFSNSIMAPTVTEQAQPIDKQGSLASISGGLPMIDTESQISSIHKMPTYTN